MSTGLGKQHPTNMFTRIIILFIALITAVACAPSPGQEVAAGNQSFADGDYAGASEAYQAAVDLAPAQAEPLYNLANARYRQGVYTDTHQLLPQAATLGSEQIAAQSHFNSGNAHYQLQDWEAAVESYKDALRINPDDVEAKYNLELAMRNLSQTDQQDNQDQQQDQEQDQNEEDQQAQEEDQEGQGDQDEQQEDNQEGQENGEQPQDDPQGESENPQNGDQEPEEESPEEPQEQNADTSDSPENEEAQRPQDAQQQNAQPSEGLTLEQARQLLRAVGQNTETLQEQMQLVLPNDGPPPEKDW